jgi:hypothetical protein
VSLYSKEATIIFYLAWATGGMQATAGMKTTAGMKATKRAQT